MSYGVKIRWEQFDVTGSAHIDDLTGMYGDRVRSTALPPGMRMFLNSHSDTMSVMTDASTLRRSSGNPLCVRALLIFESAASHSFPRTGSVRMKSRSSYQLPCVTQKFYPRRRSSRNQRKYKGCYSSESFIGKRLAASENISSQNIMMARALSARMRIEQVYQQGSRSIDRIGAPDFRKMMLSIETANQSNTFTKRNESCRLSLEGQPCYRRWRYRETFLTV